MKKQLNKVLQSFFVLSNLKNSENSFSALKINKILKKNVGKDGITLHLSELKCFKNLEVIL